MWLLHCSGEAYAQRRRKRLLRSCCYVLAVAPVCRNKRPLVVRTLDCRAACLQSQPDQASHVRRLPSDSLLGLSRPRACGRAAEHVCCSQTLQLTPPQPHACAAYVKPESRLWPLATANSSQTTTVGTRGITWRSATACPPKGTRRLTCAVGSGGLASPVTSACHCRSTRQAGQKLTLYARHTLDTRTPSDTRVRRREHLHVRATTQRRDAANLPSLAAKPQGSESGPHASAADQLTI